MRIKNLIKLPFQYFLLCFSGIINRNKKTWVFSSANGSWNDNAKYLYIYITENRKDINAIWISKDKNVIRSLKEKGLSAYYRKSLKGLLFSLQAGVYIYSCNISDINKWTHLGAVKINLWHGIPLKKIGFDITTGPTAHIYNNSITSRINHPSTYVKADYMLSISEPVSKILSDAFLIDQKNCWGFGYPRNEIFNKNHSEIMDHIKKYEDSKFINLIKSLSQYRKVYIYMPTWRDSGNNFISDAKIDFEKLSFLFKKNNYLLILKLHKNTKIKNLKFYENIVNLCPNQDVYPLLPFTHCLITDYSSIFFDYIAMNKELIFFNFDEEQYLSERGFYFDYKKILKGFSMVSSFDDLLKMLEHPNPPPKINQNLRKIVTPTTIGNANKLLIDAIRTAIYSKNT